ncbi:hypothetical protein NXX53_17930 [Bacteroides salyersiae]|nr:hypothetical protein [Bacteroides salyersiae]
MNCEKKTATQLGKAGYETYIPTQQEIHQWSDRKKKSQSSYYANGRVCSCNCKRRRMVTQSIVYLQTLSFTRQ